MQRTLCICSLLPAFENRTRVVLVMPWRETGRSSNTGRLARLVLARSEVRIRGLKQQPFDDSGLERAGQKTLVLYPQPDAEVLTAESAPSTLVVLDGTWRQARRAMRHEASLRSLEVVRLPPGSPSRYRLRRAREAHQLCTYEAVARAMGILEGAHIEASMMQAFDVMVERSLQSRGRARQPNR